MLEYNSPSQVGRLALAALVAFSYNSYFQFDEVQLPADFGPQNSKSLTLLHGEVSDFQRNNTDAVQWVEVRTSPAIAEMQVMLNDFWAALEDESLFSLGDEVDLAAKRVAAKYPDLSNT